MDTNELTEKIVNNEDKKEQPNMKESSVTSKKQAKKRSVRNFPQFSIDEAMKIPKIIGQKNSGNPWSPEHVADVLNVSVSNTNFFYLTSASRDYGFTTGTSKAKTIELTALGRKIAFPESEQDEIDAINIAFENIDLFKRVNEYYMNGSIPENKYFENTLKEAFSVPSELISDFIDVFKKNTSLIKDNPSQTKTLHTITNSNSAIQNNVENINQQGDLFVIMPFSEKTGEYPNGYFDEVFNSLLVPAASEIGLVAKTAKRDGSDIIHSTIVSEINNAQIILADLTEHNPNVLFELGLAIAFKKRVVLIRAKGTKAIFDVDNLMRVFDYNKNLWKSTIERDVPNLSKHIQSTLDSDDATYLDILLQR